MRPLFRIIIIVAAIVLVGLVLYFGWKLIAGPGNGPGTPNVPGGGFPVVPITPGSGDNPPGDGSLPPSGTPSVPAGNSGASLKKLSDFPVFAFATASSGVGEIAYLTPEGKAYAAREGPDLELSSQGMDALGNASPSPDGGTFLVSAGDPRAPQWFVFDVADRAWRPLPQEIRVAAWDMRPNGLLAVIRNGAAQDLVRADLSSTPPKYQTLVKGFSLADIGFLALTSDVFLVTERPSALAAGRAWRWNGRTGLLELVFPAAPGRLIAATPDRAVLFGYTAPDEFRIMGRDLQELEPVVWFTFPEKCGGGASTTYCFVPTTIPRTPHPILPDDYFTGALTTSDELHAVDFGTGSDTTLLAAGANIRIDAGEVLATPVAVYFLNRADASLYALTLNL